MSTPKEQRFTEVYLAYYAYVLGYLIRRSAGHDARDAAAEVFTVLWRRFDELPADVEPLPWLYGIAARVLANQRSVTAAGPGLVIVGEEKGLPAGVVPAVWTSVDGLTWSRVPHDDAFFGVDGGFMTSVTVADSGLVAVGATGGLGAVWVATPEN